MSTIVESIIVKAPVKKVFGVISDFRRYPEFQYDLESVKIIRATSKHVRVRFVANIIQKIEYTLDFTLRPPGEVTWRLVEGGGIIKQNSGSWKITELEKGASDLTFQADMAFAFWIPKSIPEGVIRTHLPAMLKNMKKQAEKKRK